MSLKWVVQQGIPVLPKTHKKEYMLENIDLFDWELSEDEMAQLSAADTPRTGLSSGDCDVV